MKGIIFGPVQSRRLGSSLGIDLTPYKTCNLDCVYCECGRTTNLTDKRACFYKVGDVLKEIDDAVKRFVWRTHSSHNQRLGSS